MRKLDAGAGIARIVDLGCGTGASGAAFALEANGGRVDGVDRNRWAVSEANWTYGVLGLRGGARVGDIVGRLKAAPTARSADPTARSAPTDAILAAYSVNELDVETQNALLRSLIAAHDDGAALLIVEPIARRANRWWDSWRDALTDLGGREDEWRFRLPLPARQQALARAAGLDPRELTARSLHVPSARARVH